MVKKLLITFLLLVNGGSLALAQEINFSTFADYGLEITNNPNDLNFNEVGPIIADGSTYSIAVNNGNATVIEITGVKFLDIFIEVQGPANLTRQSGSTDEIGLTLKAAYSNRKGNIGNPGSVPLKYINVPSNNSFTIRAPILERQSQPPGPPPTPPTNQTNAVTVDKTKGIFETFYLYLYGDITVPGDASAGSYSGNIIVNVSYDSF